MIRWTCCDVSSAIHVEENSCRLLLETSRIYSRLRHSISCCMTKGLATLPLYYVTCLLAA